ncbi:MAG: hypothetical protein AB1938_13970 [Myxococcota bacterium]
MTPLLAVLLSFTPDGGVDCGGTPCATYRTAKEALAVVLAEQPSVLAVGEYHQLEGQPKVMSGVKRFTRELLPSLEGRAGSLVVETWMVNGRCGEVEKKSVEAVKKTTKRPDETEDEVTALLDASYKLGLANHILLLDCDDYRRILDEKGGLDAEKTLVMVREKVEETALRVREKGEAGTPDKVLVLFGGALHNDLVPGKDDEAYVFGPALSKATDGGYVELDLLVPEFVSDDPQLVSQAWFQPALALSARGKVVLLSPSKGTWLLFFPKTKPKRK